MAKVALLVVVLTACSFSARAQDVRYNRVWSGMRDYMDNRHCTYTFVVPFGYQTGECSPSGQTSSSAETEEETDGLKNQVNRLWAVVDALLSRVESLSGQLSEEKARTAQLEQNLTQLNNNLTQKLQEQETRLQAQEQVLLAEIVRSSKLEQNLTRELQDMEERLGVMCSCDEQSSGDNVEPTKPTSPTEQPATAEISPRIPIPPPFATEIVGLDTGFQLRLADGSTPLEGRVEVRNGTGQWGSICDDNWDLQDAHVVCRQLGFGAALEVKLAGHYGEGSGNIWLDEVACRGNETNLGDCPANSWGSSDCSHKEDAGVICEAKNPVRLVGGQVPWEGRVDVRPGERSEWRAVCNTSWTEADAGVVCRQLGYPGGKNAAGQAGFGEGTGRTWRGDVSCRGDENSILSCGFNWEQTDCSQGQHVGVFCTADVAVRLNGSQDPLRGRVEVRPGNGEWGTICDDGFDDRDAQVVCRQLGYRGGVSGVATVGGVFEEGTGPIWLEELNCTGNESSVADCQISRWESHDCTHKEDAGVICSVGITEADCADHYASGRATSGIYSVGSSSSSVLAYCDLDTAGGGWTVIQRRQDGSVPFNRTWEEYKHGFGAKNGEYWLGNENIHLLTNQNSYRLRVELEDWNGDTRYADYSSFRVSGEADGYRLQLSGYTGNAGDSMTGSYSNNGQRFSTVDRDNDVSSSHVSQQYGQGGWWIGLWTYAFLNGRYLGNCGNSCPSAQGVVWAHWKGWNYSLKSASMKIKPN